MSTEINQIIACDEEAKSQVVNTEDTMILSSPHFDKDDSLFTDLSVGGNSFKEVSEDKESNSPLSVKLNDKGEVESIEVFGVELPQLDIKSVFVDGNALLIEKSDGSTVGVVNSDLSEDLVTRVADEIMELINSGDVPRTRWEKI